MANISRVKPGDRVTVNIRGRVFDAVVEERTEEGLRIQPPKNINYYNVTSRQVTKVHKWDPRRTQIKEA